MPSALHVQPPAFREPVALGPTGETETMYPDAAMAGAFVGVIDHEEHVGIHARERAGRQVLILLSPDDARLLAAELIRRADREA
ncbi:hypothetical protein F9C11_20495 [Amycolatopsis sp. VS8301801F10]|uniref:hypothetical protein n=1 Tax=unclassified Amycolatopsis TaxID=2618356 RepID=UPI0038FC139E